LAEMARTFEHDEVGAGDDVDQCVGSRDGNRVQFGVHEERRQRMPARGSWSVFSWVVSTCRAPVSIQLPSTRTGARPHGLWTTGADEAPASPRMRGIASDDFSGDSFPCGGVMSGRGRGLDAGDWDFGCCSHGWAL
jgi:hypothetical protein